ncbi:HAD family hydrolase [Dongia sp.]|uniref:HAD family hydrolase n=1 Tax=Dongia sp. TaxID=1977262 RepID=UPI0035AEFBDC
MRAFDLIIFDCDGVLIDSEVLACEAVRQQLSRHGIDLAHADIMARFLGRSFAEVQRYYEAHWSQPLPASFVAALRDEMRLAFTEHLAAMPYVSTLLQHLDIPFCLASSSDPERVEFSLRLAGLYPYFKGRIFTASEVAAAKPAPDLFLLAAKRMGCDPGRCLVIEDSVSGIEAAKAAGMSVWGFVGGSHHAGEASVVRLEWAGAARIFAHMSDIEAALRFNEG